MSFYLPLIGVPILAAIPCVVVKKPKAGPTCSTPTRSVVITDIRNTNAPEKLVTVSVNKLVTS